MGNCLKEHQCLGQYGQKIGKCLASQCAHRLTDEMKICLNKVEENPQKSRIVDKFANHLFNFDSDVIRDVLLIDCLNLRQAEIQLSYLRGDGRQLDMGWDSDLIINGHNVPLHGYPRYDNDYANIAWGEKVFAFDSENCALEIDFEASPIPTIMEDCDTATTTTTTTTTTENTASSEPTTSTTMENTSSPPPITTGGTEENTSSEKPTTTTTKAESAGTIRTPLSPLLLTSAVFAMVKNAF